MSVRNAIYAHLPVRAQHLAVSTTGLYWRWLDYGPGYEAYVKAFEAREAFNSNEWQRWQSDRLGRLLSVAADSVPYYRHTWSDAQRAAARAGRLEGLPLLSKDPVRANPEAFVRRDVHPRRTLVYRTSGSTGTPITTFWTVQAVRKNHALREARSLRWAGLSFRMPRATWTGELLEPHSDSNGPFSRYNLAEHQAFLSAYHLSPHTARSYVEALRRYRSQWIMGYAFSSYLLARYILEQGLSVPPLKGVVTTSEKLTAEMRAVMEAAYGCRIFEEYSSVENALFASECEQGRLHVSPDAGVVEILRPDGRPCAPGEVGEVVTTSFIQQYQPLIRYRIGDLASWAATPCECGRQMPVLEEVIGRLEEVVTGPDGRQLVRFHSVFIGQPHVREGQIVQESVSCIRVKVVPTSEFGPQDSQALVDRVRQRLGSGVEVTVELVDRIPRAANGKMRAVISLVGKA